MPLFIYFRAQNQHGYSAAIQWVPNLRGDGSHHNKNVFQQHQVTDDEARWGIGYLVKKYKARVRVQAVTKWVHCSECSLRKYCGVHKLCQAGGNYEIGIDRR